jgi:hypothetical protein
LKTSYSLPQTPTSKHIPNPNKDLLSNPQPSGDAPCSSSALSEAEQSEKTTVPSTNQEDTDTNASSIVTRKGRKCVPIQTISPVPLANSNVQKRKSKQIHRSIVLTSSPYISEVKEKDTQKKK